MHGVFGDARYAVRTLRRSPAFTATAIACLGLAIGANAALFSIFNALLWKPLPARDPEALVRLFTKLPAEGRLYRGFSLPEYEEYALQTDVLAGLSATRGFQAAFRASGIDAVRVFGEAVSDGYFEMLGVSPRLGRGLSAGDGGRPTRSAEVVVSDRFWRQRLQASPAVVGQTVWLSDVAYTVVGVAPPGFGGTYPSPIFAADLWLPLGSAGPIDGTTERALRDRSRRSLGLIGRLRPGVGIEQARAALETVAARLDGVWPESNAGVTVLVFKELDTRPEVYSSRAVNRAAVLFLGLTSLVLIVACANLANLILARASGRRKEMAVRAALGASRAQLAAQLATESLVLSLAAGLVGLLVAYLASAVVSAARLPTDLPIVLEVVPDARVVGCTLFLSLVAALALSVVPALRTARSDLVSALENDEIGWARRGQFGMNTVLLVVQVAVSLVLVVAATLLWRSIAGTNAIDPGMQLSRRTLVSFSPSLLGYDASRAEGFYRLLMARVRALPEVDGAGLVGWVPLGFSFDEGSFLVRGHEARDASDATAALVNAVDPGALDALGTRLRRGRQFTIRDTAESQPVAIVNETLARRAWPGDDPLGRQLREDRPDAPWLTVVGVVADGKYRTLTEPARPLVLRPLLQRPSESLTLVAVAAGDMGGALGAIRHEVHAIDPGMPLLDVKTLEQQMAKVRFVPQALASLAGPAAALAVLIAGIGLYGVLAYSVSRRTREFGIRCAVGAQARDVIAQVLRQGVSVVGVGLGLGAVAAFGISRLMRHLLVGVSSTDPMAFLFAITLLLGVGVLAAYLPARRAGQVEPMIALRQD